MNFAKSEAKTSGTPGASIENSLSVDALAPERILENLQQRGRPEGRTMLHGLTAYISAGGRGTRLNPIFQPDDRLGVSKALLKIGHPPLPLIEHHINKLIHAGAPTIVVGVGDHDNVARHVASIYGQRLDVNNACYEHQLGNGGDLIRTIREMPELFGENVLIANVDTLIDIDEAQFLTFHQARGAGLSIAVTMNKNVPNEGAFFIDEFDKVVYSKEATANSRQLEVAEAVTAYRASSTGTLIARTELLHDMDWQPEDGPLSLYGAVVGAVLAIDQMFAYNNGERLFTDVGTVQAWQQAQEGYAAIAPYIHYEI